MPAGIEPPRPEAEDGCRQAAAGFALGYVGFHGAPMFMSSVIPQDQEIAGDALFFILCRTFFHVHGYFLDSVIWRRRKRESLVCVSVLGLLEDTHRKPFAP